MKSILVSCGTLFLVAGCAFDAASDGAARAPAGDGGENTGRGGSSGAASGGTSTAGTYGTGGSGGAAPTGGSSYGGSSSGGGAGVTTIPEPNDGDNYSAPGTNPFVVTRHDPLSTFAADADTASYDIFRRDVETGFLPEPASVRLEEYVNSFDYEYEPPAADAAEPFSIHLSAAPGFFGLGTALLRVGIQGRLPSTEKKPANLVFLVDVSGSMASADKLPLVKVVLSETLEVLEPADTVSIVTYAGSTGVRLVPTPVSNAAAIRAAISSLEAGGSTAGAAGIDLAYAQAEAGFIEGGTNHVLLCTDGDFNVGPSSTDELIRIIEERRRTGITLTVLGFGAGNLNDALMEGVADAGNGIYSVISSEDQAIEYANERMLANLEHIAKDMKIQVEFNPERVHAYRLLGYENRAIADDDFRDDLVDAGEVGAGHAVTALYQMVPTGIDIPTGEGAPTPQDGMASTAEPGVSGDDWVLVRVRYKQPGAAETDPATEVTKLLRAEDVAAGYTELDADFRWALAVSAFAEILKQSPYADPARLDAIGAVVHDAEHQARSDRAEFAALFDLALPLVTARR
jgi:Ca-activated chloride channel family protein